MPPPDEAFAVLPVIVLLLMTRAFDVELPRIAPPTPLEKLAKNVELVIVAVPGSI